MSSENRPAALDDPAQLHALYQEHGDAQIALMLNCSKGTVRNARRRHGIESRPTGRPRGTAPQSPPHTVDDTTLLRLIERIASDQAAASEWLLANRIRSLAEARTANDTAGYDDALLAIASACCRIHRHRHQLRRAA